ncbi:IS66 family insertion sequence element accessory protein TnpB [Hydrogenophaga sp.]|uniref:IS66 family insertion sequence element accessory protein TnpB n=1 Tax=Hydrogenophaga sp. TaxID=1904254 RepID=UPI0025C4D16F|nr:IS66 family insertion sequence element accessory protein TnpB [Hydrogenophaga sp.]
MTSKKFNREHMQRCLDVLDALARSGLSTEDFAQAQGLSYGQLRSWLSHGPRWRLQLADPAYVAPARRRAGKGTGFVQVNVGDGQTPAANAGHAAQTDGLPNVRIDCSQGARSVVLHWPSGAPLQCAQWLKAYLA